VLEEDGRPPHPRQALDRPVADDARKVDGPVPRHRVLPRDEVVGDARAGRDARFIQSVVELALDAGAFVGVVLVDVDFGARVRIAAGNYVNSLLNLRRFEEAKILLRKTISVARRVLGESDQLTLRMRANYARALYQDGATLDDLREVVSTFEDLAPTARRVFGGAHPTVVQVGISLQTARATLRASETPPPGSS
jgi:hypothetical protein